MTTGYKHTPPTPPGGPSKLVIDLVTHPKNPGESWDNYAARHLVAYGITNANILVVTPSAPLAGMTDLDPTTSTGTAFFKPTVSVSFLPSDT